MGGGARVRGVASTWGRGREARPGICRGRGGAEGRGRVQGAEPKAPGCPPPPSPPGPQVLGLCGAANRPTEEIDLRSVGWGNIFQLPFKHVRDFRLRHLVPFFIYSGFEVLFACTGLALVSAACRG